jgi:uncharacterized membrane protein YdjX (TVP38/TMEM64 family)
MTHNATEPPGRRSWAWRILPLAVLLMAGVLLVVHSGGPHQVLAKVAANREWLGGLVRRHVLATALAYVAVYAGLMLLLWIPAWLCTVIGGYLFGLWLGAPLALAGVSTGAVAVFVLARSGLGGSTERAGPFVRNLETGFRRDAFSYLLVLRLIPVFPSVVVNLVPPMLGVPLRTFALATVLGITPSTVIYASIGTALGAVAEGEIALDRGVLLQPRVVLPLVGLAVLALLPVLYRALRGGRTQPPQ